MCEPKTRVVGVGIWAARKTTRTRKGAYNLKPQDRQILIKYAYAEGTLARDRNGRSHPLPLPPADKGYPDISSGLETQHYSTRRKMGNGGPRMAARGPAGLSSPRRKSARVRGAADRREIGVWPASTSRRLTACRTLDAPTPAGRGLRWAYHGPRAGSGHTEVKGNGRQQPGSRGQPRSKGTDTERGHGSKTDCLSVGHMGNWADCQPSGTDGTPGPCSSLALAPEVPTRGRRREPSNGDVEGLVLTILTQVSGPHLRRKLLRGPSGVHVCTTLY